MLMTKGLAATCAGVVSLWCCTVALFLAFLRRPMAAWRQPPMALMQSLLPGSSGNLRHE